MTAFDAGKLIPILVEFVNPGDHLKYDLHAYVRMATPLFPMFSNQRIDTHWFFVPYRLIWEHFARFMGEQSNPGASIDFLIPQYEGKFSGDDVGSVADYMGLPVAGQIAPGEQLIVSAMPFRAMNLIWNTWFKDQNIQFDVTVNTDDGPDPYTDYPLLARAKSHDYITSALPWAQKFTAPSVPLAGIAPVTGIGFAGGDRVAGSGVAANYYETSQLPVAYPAGTKRPTTGNAIDAFGVRVVDAGGGVYYPAIYADLASATGVAINQFRQAFMVQTILERDARGGTRYTELIRSHWDVINPDFRLQRPEYIGGGATPLQLTPIAQTAPTAGVPLGALGAAGTGAGRHSASYAATEHGVILAFLSIKSELLYQQGVRRQWLARTRYDLPWPELMGLGEQAVTRAEVYYTGDNTNDDAVFGYQERYHEYRTHMSQVTGIMRSTAAGTLDAWHLGQKFTSAPTLSDAFIQDTPPMARVLAAGSAAAGQQYYADLVFTADMVRPISMYGTPTNLGRF